MTAFTPTPKQSHPDAPRPWLHLRRSDHDVVADGQHQTTLGRPIPRPDGARAAGVWASWTWDGHALEVRNDRWGMYPIFIYERPGELIVASDLDRIVAHASSPLELNDDALGVFLRLGYYLGDEMPVQNVKVLPPASVLRWEDGRLSIESDGLSALAPTEVDGDAGVGSDAVGKIIDRGVALFSEAVAQSLPSDVSHLIVPLSGGRDSRHILLEMTRQGAPPRLCLTVSRPAPFTFEADQIVAAKLARQLGVAHRVLPAESDALGAERWKNSLTSFTSDEHAWFRPLVHALAKERGVVLDGLAGDVFTGGLGLNAQRLELCERGRWRELAEQMIVTPEHLLHQLLSPDAMRRFPREPALDRIEAELRRHAGQPRPISSFLFWNRTRREVSMSPYGCMAGSGIDVRTPYLDPDYADLMLSLPERLLMNGEFRDVMLRRAYPRAADIPFADKRAPGRMSPAERARHMKLAVAAGRSASRHPRGLIRRRGLSRHLLKQAARGRTDVFTSIVLATYLTQLTESISIGR